MKKVSKIEQRRYSHKTDIEKFLQLVYLKDGKLFKNINNQWAVYTNIKKYNELFIITHSKYIVSSRAFEIKLILIIFEKASDRNFDETYTKATKIRSKLTMEIPKL